MSRNSDIIALINDLVRINKDRIQWYEQAILALKDEDLDLVGVFETNKHKSECHNAALEDEIRDLGGEVAAGNTIGGEIHRIWRDVVTKFKGRNRHAVLMNCEAGEMAAQRAYQDALENPLLPGYLQELLGVQRQELERTHRRVESMKTTAF